MDLLVNTYGTRIRSRGERIVLAFPDGKKHEYPARRIEKIIILRPSSISTGAVQLALEHFHSRVVKAPLCDLYYQFLKIL